jgi:tripeptide aminopeptidase
LPGNPALGSPLMLVAHMDTVATTAGIKPVIENGTIRSDGTTILGADNRAGVALILFIAQELEGQKAHRPIELVFTVAEELGMLGALQLNFDHLQAKNAYIFDCSAKPGSYVERTPTAYDFKLIFKGRPSHSAVAPEKGINALQMALQVLNRFPVGRINEDTVANIGTVHGGSADNVVPDHMTVTGEFRSFKSSEIERLRKQLNDDAHQAADTLGGLVDAEFTLSFDGFQLSSDKNAVRRLRAVFEKLQLTANPMTYYGGSDANVFNAKGITAVNVGIGAQGAHSHQESIDLADMQKSAEIVFELLSPEG